MAPYKVRTYNHSGQLQKEVYKQSLAECRQLWLDVIDAGYPAPTVWKLVGQNTYTRLTGF